MVLCNIALTEYLHKLQKESADFVIRCLGSPQATILYTKACTMIVHTLNRIVFLLVSFRGGDSDSIEQIFPMSRIEHNPTHHKYIKVYWFKINSLQLFNQIK